MPKKVLLTISISYETLLDSTISKKQLFVIFFLNNISEHNTIEILHTLTFSLSMPKTSISKGFNPFIFLPLSSMLSSAMYRETYPST